MAVQLKLKDLQALVEYLGPRDKGDPRGDGRTPGHATIELTEAPIEGVTPTPIKSILAKVAYEFGPKNETVESWYLIANSVVVKVR